MQNGNIGPEGRTVGSGSSEVDSRRVRSGVIEAVKVVVSALLIAFGIRTVLYEPFNIPSESMLPTLMVGDYLFVSKYAYGYSHHSIIFSPPLFDGRIFADRPDRGDIVVFKLPRDDSTDYIKRIIGLPGDRIRMQDGVLEINGEPVTRERIDDFVVKESPNAVCMQRFERVHADGESYCHYPRHRETLPNGVSYDTLDLESNGPNDTTRVFVVPEGHYFMMGDNRDNSQDSRRPTSVGVGYVPFENLVGRAEIVFYSTDGRAQLWEPWQWIQATRFRRIFDLL